MSSRHKLEGALLGTGFPFRDGQEIDTFLESFRQLHPKVAGIRRAGSAALDLAYVAAGRLDGFWEFNLKPWDIAAGALLVQEAGGINSELLGGTDYLESGNIIAANPKMMKAMLQHINKAKA